MGLWLALSAAGKGIAIAAIATTAVATTVAIGNASGIANALTHMPTWTHAHAVLEAVAKAFASGTHPTPPHPTHPGPPSGRP